MSEEKTTGHPGGNITFQPGKGAGPDVTILPGRDGSFIFRRADETEALRIDPEGGFFVDGLLIATNQEVYDSFRAWLRHATAQLEPGAVIEGV